VANRVLPGQMVYNPNIYFSRSSDGYLAHVDADHDQEIHWRMIDMSGRVVLSEKKC
jgi:hypothetical protein